jgi:hypothetical protein
MTLPVLVPDGAAVELHFIPNPLQPEIRVWYGDSVVHVVRLHR